MVYAILHAASDHEELITVAHGDTAEDLARWFIDELQDTADMYLTEDADFEKLEKIVENLEVLCDSSSSFAVTDADSLEVVANLTVEVGEIALAVVGAYETYDGFAEGLREYLADKPAFRHVDVPDDADGDIEALDKLNASLIRSGLN